MNDKEFEISLSSLDTLRDSNSETVRKLYGEEIAAMVSYDQNNPHHCFDLWNHTIHTVGALQEDAPIVLKIAAFYHDIGKPLVAKAKDGRTVYYGHAMRSAEMTERLLRQMEYSEGVVKEICFYVRHHDDFISWVLPDEKYDRKNLYLKSIIKRNIDKHIQKVQIQEKQLISVDKWNSMLDLCRADVTAQVDEVWQRGILMDSKEHKLKRIALIRKLINT